MSQVTTWKASFDRWSTEETEVLINEWAPLYRRRRRGAKDAWVPLYIRGRARSCRALVTEDWRAVAFAVNSYRANTARLDSCRTHVQCKHRVEHLKKQYMKGQAARMAWPLFSVLHAVWADEVAGHSGAGAAEGRGAPAGDAGGTAAAAGALDGAAADEGGSAAANADSGTGYGGGRWFWSIRQRARHSDGWRKCQCGGGGGGLCPGRGRYPRLSGGEAAVDIEGAAATAGDAGGTATASVDACGGAFVDEDSRAAAIAVKSSRTADGVRCRVHVKPLRCIYEEKHDAVFGADVDEEGGGAPENRRGTAGEAARRRATFVPLIPKRPRSAKPRVSEPADATVADLSAEALATGGSVDAVVVLNLAQIYKELRMKVLDVEREKARWSRPPCIVPPVMRMRQFWNQSRD